MAEPDGAPLPASNARVDESILGLYLSGANTGRISGALQRLLRGGPLSKDAASHLVDRLAEDLWAWSQWHLPRGDPLPDPGRLVRGTHWAPEGGGAGAGDAGGAVERATDIIGRSPSRRGERGLLRRGAGGSGARTIGAPVLAIIDGNPGLHAALRAHWPGITIQRCTNHKLRNLLSKAPAGLREGLHQDYRRMIYAEGTTAVQEARITFASQ
jgi:putative transposase